VLDCREVSPQQAGFPGARTIAKLRRRVRRKGKKSTEIVYLISSLTLDQFNALGFLQLKRAYWVIESRLHQTLDVTMAEDQSRVSQPNAALVLGMFRRVAVSLALTWVTEVKETKPRASARNFQKQFHHRDGGTQRLESLIFSKFPKSWRLAK
jgi:predicted transposase YbfD/YdcC